MAALLIFARVICFGCFGDDCGRRIAMLKILRLRRYCPRDVTRGSTNRESGYNGQYGRKEDQFFHNY